MTDKRLLLALPALALLAACGGEKTPSNDSRSASGEVLEGTISDSMLPVDRVRSEPPLEDPEAFAKAQSAADGAEGAPASQAEGGETTETGTGATGDAAPAEESAAPAAE